MRRTRRRGSRLARAAGLAILLLACALYAAGRALTDRLEATQFLFWIPSWMLVGPGAAGLLLYALGRPRRPGLALATAAVLACAGHMAVIDLGLTRLAGPRPAGAALRVLNWNVSWIKDQDRVEAVLADHPFDVAVLVNPNAGIDWRRVMESVPGPKAIVWDAGMLIISHLSIHTYGYRWLGIEGLPQPPPLNPEGESNRQTPFRDPGRALWFELDASATLGRSITVWVMDLPSEPRMWRMRIARDARAAVEAWTGPTVLRDEQGRFTRDTTPANGFPAPDLVLGDLNIPRGSASLGVLAPGMHHAFSDAGRGWSATFPRRFPLVHIDHALLAPAFIARRYDVFNPGAGHHYAQVTEVLPK